MIRTDWDTGFKEGRQYGRGKTGGQVRNMRFVGYLQILDKFEESSRYWAGSVFCLDMCHAPCAQDGAGY